MSPIVLARALACASVAVAATPSEARFLQVDPVGYKDQVNLYAYVGDDPVNAVDPSGLSCVQSQSGSWSCQIDKVDTKVNGRTVERNATAADRKRYGAINSSLSRAVNAAATSGKTENISVNVGKKTYSFSISGAKVAQSLAGRTIVVNPFGRNDAMNTQNGVTTVDRAGIDPTQGHPGASTVFGDADRTRSVEFLHEGIHGTPEEANGFGSAAGRLGTEPLSSDHQDPYNRAADDLLGPN